MVANWKSLRKANYVAKNKFFATYCFYPSGVGGGLGGLQFPESLTTAQELDIWRCHLEWEVPWGNRLFLHTGNFERSRSRSQHQFQGQIFKKFRMIIKVIAKVLCKFYRWPSPNYSRSCLENVKMAYKWGYKEMGLQAYLRVLNENWYWYKFTAVVTL